MTFIAEEVKKIYESKESEAVVAFLLLMSLSRMATTVSNK